MELHAFELAGSTAGPPSFLYPPVFIDPGRLLKSLPLSEAGFLLLLQQMTSNNTNLYCTLLEVMFKWVCRLMERRCFAAFSSFLTPPTFLGAWPLPPTLKPLGEHLHISPSLSSSHQLLLSDPGPLSSKVICDYISPKDVTQSKLPISKFLSHSPV